MAEKIQELEAQDQSGEESSTDGPEEFSVFDEGVGEDTKEPFVPISELRKVRAEAAKYRKQLRQLESRAEREGKVARLAKMEETDRLKAIAEDTKAEARALREKAGTVAKQAAAINAASALGFHNPKDAASLVDLSQVEVDAEMILDERKVEELVKSVARSRPYLIRGQQDGQDVAQYGPTNPASDNWPKPRLRTQEQIDRMKQQSNELMRKGRTAAAVRLYNKVWEKERSTKKQTGG